MGQLMEFYVVTRGLSDPLDVRWCPFGSAGRDSIFSTFTWDSGCLDMEDTGIKPCMDSEAGLAGSIPAPTRTSHVVLAISLSGPQHSPLVKNIDSHFLTVVSLELCY